MSDKQIGGKEELSMKNKLIHLGSPMPGLPEKLRKSFNYINIPFEKIEEPNEADHAPLFIKGELNLLYSNALFLITQEVYLTESNILKQLPANSIIVDEALKGSGAEAEILKLKNAQFINFNGLEELSKYLNQTFYSGQLGFKFIFDNIRFEPYFKGKIEQNGHNYIKFIDKDIKEYQKVANWGGPLVVAGDTLWEIRTEFKRQNETTNIRLDVSMIDPQTNEIYYTHGYENDELNHLLPLKISNHGAYIFIEISIKGSDIDLDVGQISLRQARDGRGTLLIGEKEMVDDEAMNEQLYYYFDPGDLKPPLVVYFSGFRFSLGVEGVFMLRELKAPSLIFGEQRVLGGAFYVGGKKFEKEIIRIIQATLKKLGFTSDQLILSGLSMGTYASLYYSSYLDPQWVVVGKPLTKLGDIAANERINRPNSFSTSLDILQRLTGGISDENIEQANNIFWDSFKGHDHSKTNFVITYMKEDDYDMNAFDDLYSYLHQESPKSRIIHKGLTGRHNDDTAGIVEWFLMQIRNILTAKYGRNFKVEEATDDE